MAAYDKGIFGANLRTRRAQMNVTRVRLSEMSGVGANSIGAYEHGWTAPTLGNAVALAQALGVTLDDLYPMEREEVEHAALSDG